MKTLAITALTLFLSCLLNFAWAQSPSSDPIGGSKLGEPPTTAVAPAPQITPSIQKANTDEQELNVSKINTGFFGPMLWIGALLIGGLGSFGLFLVLHKQAKVKGDALWPLIPALFAGYFIVMWPMLFLDRSTVYDGWSKHCFSSDTYGADRERKSNGRTKELCIDAQSASNDDAGGPVSISALGLNSVFGVYKDYLAGGRANAMYPGEMHFVIWLVIALYSVSIYQFCRWVRRRFFTV